ncbi:hypothetical protein J41TS4_14260 [Paenibacillus apis]|uniref:Uncharacterized protein n=1 Tax=Paenibacillus apis TaxID=1792174 RepID=A0A920CLI7_9BACL|nr:hypothetical protein J41TS4_14260 [Paenibacillus apis]
MLIPLLIVYTIHYLDQYVIESERSDVLSFESILTWIIGYYVIGMLNIVFFPEGKRE